MNYIQEELLRQRRALAALMSGQEPETEETPAPETPERALDQDRRLARRGEPGTARDGGTEMGAGTRERRAADMGRESVQDTLPGGGGLWETETARRVSEHRIEPGADWLAGPWAAANAASAGERGVDLRTVSRGFQRDARRYDGGFSMY